MSIPDQIEVWSHDRAEPRLAGTLRPSFMGRVLAGASLEYDLAFIEDGYPLSPELPLRRGRIFTPENTTIFGVLQDASPDEWGQQIIQAAHARAAHRAGVPARQLGEFDFLIGVSDLTRMGALRLRSPEDGEWMSTDEHVANMHDLPKILGAARRYEQREATDEDLAYLNGVATSPGGARPKANVVTDRGALALVKLPHSKDGDIDVERWEAVALTLARDAGIPVAPFTVAAGEGRKAVLVTERFDRAGDGVRIPYMSAFTAMRLGTHKTGANLTYVDFADTIADVTAEPRKNLHALFDRVALTTLVGNADDHWRNHGFLRVDGRWELSPVFDVNPSRTTTVNSRRISDGADPDRRTISDLLDVAEAFELTGADAAAAVARVGKAVESWPDVARAFGVPEPEIAEMSSAFAEDQIAQAVGATATAPAVIDLGPSPRRQDREMVWVKAHPRLQGSVEGYWRRRPRHSR